MKTLKEVIDQMCALRARDPLGYAKVSEWTSAIEAAVQEQDAKVERLREKLRRIAERDWVEQALDPNWAVRVAQSALDEIE